jgi:hypothetical protein
MTPKIGAQPAEYRGMSFKLRDKGRTSATCKHESLMRIEVAGMSRDVCESCGRVRIGYVEDHARARAAQRATATSPDSDGSSANTA